MPPETRETLLFMQLREGLREEFMRASQDSGIQRYSQLCQAAKIRGEAIIVDEEATAAPQSKLLLALTASFWPPLPASRKPVRGISAEIAQSKFEEARVTEPDK